MQNTSSVPALSLVERSETARQAAMVLLFGALTAVGAQLSFRVWPEPWPPITLQVLMVLLSGALLGPRLGAASQLAYLGIGFMGAPVFAEGRGGLAVMLSSTAGYLVSYPVAGYLAGLLAQRARSFAALLAVLLVTSALILALGGVWLGVWSTLTHLQRDLTHGLAFGLKAGILPFLAVDLAKAVVAAGIAWPVVRSAQR